MEVTNSFEMREFKNQSAAIPPMFSPVVPPVHPSSVPVTIVPSEQSVPDSGNMSEDEAMVDNRSQVSIVTTNKQRSYLDIQGPTGIKKKHKKPIVPGRACTQFCKGKRQALLATGDKFACGPCWRKLQREIEFPGYNFRVGSSVARSYTSMNKKMEEDRSAVKCNIEAIREAVNNMAEGMKKASSISKAWADVNNKACEVLGITMPVAQQC